MTDVTDIADRVLAVSHAYREVAGAIVLQARKLRDDGTIDDDELASVRAAHDDIVSKAADMLVDLDDALAAQLDAPLKTIETATQTLKQAEARIATVTRIVDVAIKGVAAAAAVAVFFAAPTVAAAGTAAAAVGGVVSAIAGS